MNLNPPDAKYIVFKREHWQRAVLESRDTGIRRLRSLALDDAVVIRTQDSFAGPALHTYAANVAFVVNLLESLKIEEGAKDLQRVADYFHERALEADEIAQNNQAKLPD